MLLAKPSRRVVLFCAAILCVVAVWAYQSFAIATLTLTSEPDGAVVWVDGRRQGVTPIERLELDLGAHRLEVKHSHYAAYVEGIDVQRGDHLEREVQLQAGQGKFEFLSNPRGAWVEINGERLPGVTPLEHTTASGPHVIRMGQEERRTVQESVTLNAGESQRVQFNLGIDPHGTLTIRAFPRDSQIQFVGDDHDYRPNLRLPLGEYTLRLSRSGYITGEFRLKVDYGENLHTLRLTREQGPIRVEVKPAEAELFVTYSEGGNQKSRRYQPGLRVPTGTVRIRARAAGFRTESKTVRVAPEGTSVQFVLDKIRAKTGALITDTLRSGELGPEMVVLPPGSFRMGDANGSLSEKPVRTVTITQPIAMSKYEITVGQYLAFADATRRRVSEKLNPKQTEYAVSHVSVADARAYATWLTEQTGHRYRLPTEAEWEYAARGGSTSDYFFGDDPNSLCDYANVADLTARKRFRDWDVIDCEDGAIEIGPVGRYQPNPFGVFDIYGNVSEWVSDCGLPSYKEAPTDGTSADEGTGCGSHGIRGGSWDSMAVEVKSAYRNSASSANDDRGIRLVRDF